MTSPRAEERGLATAWSRAAAHSRRLATMSAVALFVVLAGLHALTVDPFFPADEGAHLAYTAVLVDGELPRITTTVTVPGLPGFEDRIVSVANHPPLYYAMAAIVYRLVTTVGDAGDAVYALRLVNVALGALVVVLTGRLSRWLAPDRPLVEVAAMGAMALTPMAVHVFALLHNDALAVAVSAAGMLAAANVLASGAAWRHVVELGAATGAAALTRASGLALTVTALAVPIGALAARGDRRRRRVRAAAALAALTAMVVAGAGWFYVRNLLLYGDVTGAAPLLERYGRAPGPSPLRALVSPTFWLDQHRQVWARFAGGYYDDGWVAVAAWAVSAVVLVCAVITLLRRVRGGGHPDRWPSRVLWWVLASYGAAVIATLLWFVAGGGSPHTRYLLPLWPALAVGVGVVVGGAPARWRVVAVAVCAVGASVVNVAVWHRLTVAPLGPNTGLVRPDAIVSTSTALLVLVTLAVGLLVGTYVFAVAGLDRAPRAFPPGADAHPPAVG